MAAALSAFEVPVRAPLRSTSGDEKNGTRTEFPPGCPVSYAIWVE